MKTACARPATAPRQGRAAAGRAGSWAISANSSAARIIAVDWSGARDVRTQRRKLWLAEADPSGLTSLSSGRTRSEVLTHLLELAELGPLVVGLDFSFSFSAW